MTCSGPWRCLALLVLGAAGAFAAESYGQLGTSYPGACPLDKWSDVIVTVIATLPESTTGPVSVRGAHPALPVTLLNPCSWHFGGRMSPAAGFADCLHLRHKLSLRQPHRGLRDEPLVEHAPEQHRLLLQRFRRRPDIRGHRPQVLRRVSAFSGGLSQGRRSSGFLGPCDV